jgi:hypothetical protein
MKRTQDQKRTDLPSFLDSSTEAAAEDTVATEGTAALDSEDATPLPAEEGDAEPASEPGGGPEGTVVAAATPPASPSRMGAGQALRRRKASSPGGGMFLGAGVLTAALALLMPRLPVDAVAALTNQGFGPQGMFVCGMVLAAAGASMRRTARLQQKLDDAEERRAAEAAKLHRGLHGLLSAQATTNDRPAAGEEDLQHVMLALQRQDEKLNNLTKAFKMYGKPLMEIANQGTDLAGALATVKSQVEANGESSRSALLRMETQLKSPAGKQDLADLQNNMLKLVQKVEALAGQSPAAALQPLQQQVGRLEVGMAAIAQRLEDSEVRKSLLRLEESATKSRETMQELLRADGVKKAAGELQDKLDRATRGLQDGIVQLRDGNLGGLENAVRDIQREVAGVATSVAQIHAAVKSGVRVATTAAPAAAPTAAAAPAAATPAAAAASAPAPAPSAPTEPAAGDGKAADGGGYQTGSRSSGGKNVLGAIAKLKQMKS